MPTCSKCRIEKPVTDFIKNPTRRSGHNPDCKACDITHTYKTRFAAGLTVIPLEKRCPRCTVTKPASDFRLLPRSKDGLDCYCQSCQKTYSLQRYYRLSNRTHREPLHIRFWRNVNCAGGNDACWPWEGPVSSGYGSTKHANGGKTMKAHRLAWEITYGDIPQGYVIMHLCNNPLCCNVFSHLRIGTQKENMGYCASLGRMPGHAKCQLTPISDNVPRIRYKRKVGKLTLEERFWEKVLKTEDTQQCWYWTGCLVGGYGTIQTKEGSQKAHRIAYMLFYGPIPDGYQICHHCDQRSCCNPLHLFAGTKNENLRDMISKERHAHKLSPQDVLFIYSSKGTISSSKLADQFSVTRAAISSIWNKRTWCHLLP